MSRKKPAPKLKYKVEYTALYTALEYEGSKIKIYNNGILIVKGNIKNAAFALSKQILNDRGKATSIEYNRCIKIKCKPGKPFTIEWVGEGILPDGDVFPEPKFWEEFKQEFERFCKLKAFI